MSWWNPFAWFGGPPAEVPGAAPAPLTGRLRVLAFGFNSVDPAYWNGWRGELSGCENDASDVAKACATPAAYRTVRHEVTIGPDDFCRAVRALAEASQPGDRAVLWYSGHGGTGLSGDAQESGSEYLCLPRGVLPEWTLQELLRSFRPGVQVLYGSDSCHSAGQTRGASRVSLFTAPERPKAIPQALLGWVTAQYGQVIRAAKAAAESREEQIRSGPEPDVLALAACDEKEVAYDGARNGAFTAALLDAWRRNPGSAVRRIFEIGPARLERQHPVTHQLTEGGARVWNARAFA